MLADLAKALECSTADLTGRQALTSDLPTAAAQAMVSSILNTLVEIDLNEPTLITPRPLPEVQADAELIWDLRLRCDFRGATQLLPRVLRELHAHANGAERVAALRFLVRTADAASFVVRYLGYPAEAWLASDRSRQAARQLGEPVFVALADWSIAHSATGCGAYGRALRLANNAVTAMEPHYDTPGGPEMLGQLCMLMAFSQLALGNRSEAEDWVTRADAIAERTGDVPTLGLNFGPTNNKLWRMSMELDGGEPGRAVEIARATSPAVLTVSRQAAFYLDAGRALARVQRGQEAVRMLLIAERLAPQRIRASSLAAETTRSLLEGAVGSELRGLGERMGVIS